MEAGPADVGEVAVQVLPLGVGDRVDQDVEVALPGVPVLEDLADLVVVADVAASTKVSRSTRASGRTRRLISEAIELKPTSAPWS